MNLAAKWGSLCSIEPKMTPSGHSAARRKLSGIPIHSCLVEGSPGKIHLIHSNQKAADIIFLPAVNDCRRRDLLAFALHRELPEEKVGPTEVSGRTRGMV